MNLEALVAVGVVCVTVVALRVLSMRHQRALQPTSAELVRLEEALKVAGKAWDANQGALKRQVDELERQLKHLDNRTRK